METPAMTFLDLLILVGAILYIVTVLTSKSGPFDIFAKARMRNDVGGLLACAWCSVLYVSIIIILLYVFLPADYQPILWIPGLAGLAMALRAYTGINHGN